MFPAINAIADALGPWVDPIALPALRHLYFPLSRLWAAASVRPISDPRFQAETGISIGHPVMRGLATGLAAQVAQRYEAMRQVNRSWEEHFFGPDAARLGRHAEIEAERRAAAGRWMVGRMILAPLRLAADVPPVRWQIPSPSDVDTAYARFLDRPAEAFMPALPWPEIAVSHPIESGDTRSYWVRFPAPHPRLADMTSVKIVEPLATPVRATVIAGNGVCIEPELYPSRVLEIAGSLVGRGLRVIEMTSPWHGRRTTPGLVRRRAILRRGAALDTRSLHRPELGTRGSDRLVPACLQRPRRRGRRVDECARDAARAQSCDVLARIGAAGCRLPHAS